MTEATPSKRSALSSMVAAIIGLIAVLAAVVSGTSDGSANHQTRVALNHIGEADAWNVADAYIRSNQPFTVLVGSGCSETVRTFGPIRGVESTNFVFVDEPGDSSTRADALTGVSATATEAERRCGEGHG